MKIETTIPPRKDGTVTVVADGGKKYVFEADENSALVCDVENESHIGWLLGLGDFNPYDEADFGLAVQLTEPNGEGEDDGEELDDPEDDEPDMNAAPIEEPASAVAAPTAPKVAKPRKAK